MKIFKSAIEVIREYLYVATYGIPLLWVLGLAEVSMWIWVPIMVTHSIIRISLDLLKEEGRW